MVMSFVGRNHNNESESMCAAYLDEKIKGQWNSLAEYFLQIISPFQAQYRQACGQIRAERARFRQELSAISFLEVFPSQANFILCRVSAKYTATSLARLLLSRHGMLIKDLTGKEGFEEGHFIQMAVRSEADNRRLTNALRSLE